MSDKPDTPMIDKARHLEDENRLLMRFLKHVLQKWTLSRGPCVDPVEQIMIEDNQEQEALVADFQGIDLTQVAAERRKVVKWANCHVLGDGLGEGRQPGD